MKDWRVALDEGWSGVIDVRGKYSELLRAVLCKCPEKRRGGLRAGDRAASGRALGMMPIINGRLPLLRRGAIIGLAPRKAPDAQMRQTSSKNARFSLQEIGRWLSAPFVTYRGRLIPQGLCPDIPRQTMPDPALVGFGAGT
ncbi:MAG TPA: hypothetical protein VNK48_01405 [Xanthobacteraceae bacterium]|nr:hypothetical protein [Xanthobacteraceae bacterium]